MKNISGKITPEVMAKVDAQIGRAVERLGNEIEIYRYTTLKGEHCEYRFDDGICLGYFEDGERRELMENCTGKLLTDQWRRNLELADYERI